MIAAPEVVEFYSLPVLLPKGRHPDHYPILRVGGGKRERRGQTTGRQTETGRRIGSDFLV